LSRIITGSILGSGSINDQEEGDKYIFHKVYLGQKQM
jgi:hypothetical protein